MESWSDRVCSKLKSVGIRRENREERICWLYVGRVVVVELLYGMWRITLYAKTRAKNVRRVSAARAYCYSRTGRQLHPLRYWSTWLARLVPPPAPPLLHDRPPTDGYRSIHSKLFIPFVFFPIPFFLVIPSVHFFFLSYAPVSTLFLKETLLRNRNQTRNQKQV